MGPKCSHHLHTSNAASGTSPGACGADAEGVEGEEVGGLGSGMGAMA